MKQKFFITFAIIFFFGNFAMAQVAPATTPHYFHYQSKLLDEAGNPVPDGSASVMFRVIGPDDNILYQEQQTLDVVNGEAAVLLGNGLDPATGAPTGGLSAQLFTPGESRYLEVEVEGYPPTGQMEIVSVPYALYAEQSLSVATGAIDSTALAEKSVELRHFGDATLQDLADALLDQGLLTPGVTQADLTTTYREPTGATQIGVAAGLVYSAENNLQGVLRDLDRAIDKRQVNIDEEARLRDETDDALELNKLSRSGGAMTGSITMDPGTTIDGYDISTTINNINNISGTLGESKIDTTIARDAEFQAADTILSSAIATKLPLAGGAMTGNITMDTGKTVDGYDVGVVGDTFYSVYDTPTEKIKDASVADTIARDTELSTAVAAEAGLRSAADATKLSLSGGTMTGALDMGGNRVENVITGNSTDDVVRVSDLVAAFQGKGVAFNDTVVDNTAVASISTSESLPPGTQNNLKITAPPTGIKLGGVTRTTWPREADSNNTANSVSKAWVNFTTDDAVYPNTGEPAMQQSYQVDSVERMIVHIPGSSGGDRNGFRITWNRPFSNSGYVVVFGMQAQYNTFNNSLIPVYTEKTSTYVDIFVVDDDDNEQTTNLNISVLAFGVLDL